MAGDRDDGQGDFMVGHGKWDEPATQCLRFVLDFAYATGLRASELVSATLDGIALFSLQFTGAAAPSIHAGFRPVPQ